MKEVFRVESKTKLFSINWALTNSCNYKCSYCHPSLHGGGITVPSRDSLINFIEQAIKHSNAIGTVAYFEFGGGEVTTFRYFSDLIKLIHKRNGMVCVVSNGSRSLRWWRNNSKYLNGVSLSYHINDVLNEEHFIEVAKLLENAKNTRLHVNVMMLPQRFNDCYLFAERLKKKVKCSIALQPLYEGFGSGKITKKYAYTDEQELIMQTFRGRPEEKNLQEPRALLVVEYQDGSKEILSTFELLVNDKVNFCGWDCYVGMESIVITFAGDIYRAWCMQDEKIGSIFDEHIILPSSPTRCRTNICQCGSDISSKKINRSLLEVTDRSIVVKNVS